MALRLTLEAVDLLFQVLETPEARLSGAAAARCEERVRPLQDHGLLRAHGHADVAVLPHDDEDRPVPLFPWGEAGEMAGFDPMCGPVVVPGEHLVNWAVDLPKVIKLMMAELDLPTTAAPQPLVEHLLWEVGDARIGRRRDRLSVWFCRRLWDPVVSQQVVAVATARPPMRMRVLLTSSKPARVQTTSIAGHAVVPVQDVLQTPEGMNVSPEILEARLRGGLVMAQMAEPVWLSEDATTLVINGNTTFLFRSWTQKEAIRKLVAAYRQQRRLRALELTPTGNLSRLFGGRRWAELSPYIKSTGGLWRIEP